MNLLVEEISKKMKCPQTEIMREAVHYWLRERGIEDGLIYDAEEIVREWERGLWKQGD